MLRITPFAKAVARGARHWAAAAPLLGLLVLASIAPASAQTSAVSDNVKNLGGSACTANCEVRFRLWNAGDNTCKVTGAVSGGNPPPMTVDPATGAFSGTIYRNDYISCGGITDQNRWLMGIYINGKLWGTEQRYHITTATFVPSAATSENDAPTPNAGNDYAIRNGDNAWQGTQDFTGANVVGLDVAVGSGAPTNGISALNSLTAATQTMDAVNDANVTLSLTQSSTSNHRFTVGWIGALPKNRMFAATVYTDQANTFGAFLQKFQAGANFKLADPTDATKLVHFDISPVATGTERTVKVPDANSSTIADGSSNGQIPIWDNAAQKFVPGDPLVQGLTAHDASGAATNPVAIGGFAKAAAPTDVSADGDIVNAWFLRNGAQAVELTAAGARIPGDATNGLKVQVTTMPTTTVTGGHADNAAFTPGTTGVMPMAAEVDDTATTNVAENSAGAVRMTPSRALYVTIRDASGISQQGQRNMANSVPVVLANDQSAVPMSAASLPLPGGASTAANQATENASLSSIDTKLTNQATAANQSTANSSLSSIDTKLSTQATAANQTAVQGTPGSAVPSKAVQVAGTDGTNAVVPYIDPCQRGAKSYYPVNISTATTVRFAAPAVGKKTYICSALLVAATADNFNIIEGTGGTCGTGTAGVLGGTTAATGINAAANGGFAHGNGNSSVFATAGTNVDMCLVTSAAVQLSGHITFVQF